MVETEVNGRWTLKLPDFRAERVEWSDPGWERERLDSMHANIHADDVVYDIGTEEGDLTGLYALWGAQLVLVEPNPAVWPCVKAIWEANQFVHPLAWFQGFVTNRNAHLDGDTLGGRFFNRKGWPADATELPMVRAHGFSSLAEHDLPGSGSIVPRITIDKLVETVDVAPDVITIDVEGAEMLVLEGAYQTLDNHRPLVWVSVHDEMIQVDYGYTTVSVLQYMALHDYRAQLLAIDHESHFFFWPKERDVILP